MFLKVFSVGHALKTNFYQIYRELRGKSAGLGDR
jgi:hypothetical protein